jgi:hypothetical protein
MDNTSAKMYGIRISDIVYEIEYENTIIADTLLSNGTIGFVVRHDIT